MRAIVTGQVGMDKKPYLEAVRDLSGSQGEALEVYYVGDLLERVSDCVARLFEHLPDRFGGLRRAYHSLYARIA